MKSAGAGIQCAFFSNRRSDMKLTMRSQTITAPCTHSPVSQSSNWPGATPCQLSCHSPYPLHPLPSANTPQAAAAHPARHRRHTRPARRRDSLWLTTLPLSIARASYSKLQRSVAEARRTWDGYRDGTTISCSTEKAHWCSRGGSTASSLAHVDPLRRVIGQARVCGKEGRIGDSHFFWRG